MAPRQKEMSLSKPDEPIAPNELHMNRAACYGDGVFETMRSHNGTLPLLSRHLLRVSQGLARLGLAELNRDAITDELQVIALAHPNAVIKLSVYSSAPTGGYQRAHNRTTHHLSTAPLPKPDSVDFSVRICTTRLSSDMNLGGLKHLNRLPQVLAANEPNPMRAEEGIMLDPENHVVCGISGNVFCVINDRLCTPLLENIGVRGVMRDELLHICQQIPIGVEQRAISLAQLFGATELFLCNAVRGIRPVATLYAEPTQRYKFARNGVITEQLLHALNRVAFRA
jgi:4-amino-4-deoxychorismate lyase